MGDLFLKRCVSVVLLVILACWARPAWCVDELRVEPDPPTGGMPGWPLATPLARYSFYDVVVKASSFPSSSARGSMILKG